MVQERELTCAHCARPTTTQCGRCKNVYYCSKDCQLADWKVHKLRCEPPPKHAAAASKQPADYTKNPLCGKGFKRWLDDRKECCSMRLPEEPPRVGFTNWQNNCYLNAVFQCLLYTPMLREHLLSACPNPEDQWLAELANLFQTVDDAKHRNCTSVDPPRRLSRLIAEASEEFAPGRQADAHEAIMLLISRWLTGCLTAGDGSRRNCSKLPYNEKEQLEASSLVGHIFGMHMGQTISCGSCSYKSSVSRVEYCLCLTVTLGMTEEELQKCRQDSVAQLQQWRLRRPSGGSESAASPTTLISLLDEYTHRERIDDFKCEKCLQIGGFRSAYIERRPNVLMVYIDRRQDSQPFGKINRRVTFQPRLDLGAWHRSAEDELESGTNGTAYYSLYAMCVHQDLRGSTSSGHYVAYVKDRRGAWHHVDDTNVRAVEWTDVKDQHPYILFYMAESFMLPAPVPASPVAAPAQAAAATAAVPAQPLTEPAVPLSPPPSAAVAAAAAPLRGVAPEAAEGAEGAAEVADAAATGGAGSEMGAAGDGPTPMEEAGEAATAAGAAAAADTTGEAAPRSDDAIHGSPVDRPGTVLGGAGCQVEEVETHTESTQLHTEGCAL